MRYLSRVRVALVFLFWGIPTRLVWHWPRRAVSAALRGVRWVVLVVLHWFAAQALLLWRSPLAFYRLLGRQRDWVVAKVEYAHTESAKWRGMWTAIKLPYSGLRAMGLNPQMAVGLLVAGSTVGGGAIVNETLLRSEERRVGKECRSRWSPYH